MSSVTSESNSPTERSPLWESEDESLSGREFMFGSRTAHLMKQIVAFLTLFLCSVPALAQSPSAMITNLTGPALVVVKGEKTPAAPMMNLSPKTLIELRGGTKMTVVFFGQGTQEQYTGPALIGIGDHRGKVFHGEESARTVVATNSALVKAVDPSALSEAPGQGNLQASRGADGKTTLSWTTTTPGPYLVSIIKPAQAGKARTNVWGEEVAAKSLVYTGPKLDPSLTYIVEVKSGSVEIDTTQFRVKDGVAQALTAAQAEADGLTAADPSDTTGPVLMSALYAQHGMHQKAVEALQPALNARPSEDAFVDRLNVMGKAVNAKANKDTAYAQAIYRDQGNWGYGPYYDPEAYGWNDWDNL